MVNLYIGGMMNKKSIILFCLVLLLLVSYTSVYSQVNARMLRYPDVSETYICFVYAGDIIVIRTGENTYIALSKICTHEGCTVGYDPSTNQLPCPCHGSVYAISGAVVNGPAQNSLHIYTVSKQGDTLTIS